MKTFRNYVMKNESPKGLKDLMKLITPPTRIRRKNLNNDMMVPPDEGDELFDCEGGEYHGGSLLPNSIWTIDLYFKPHLNFISNMKIKSMFTFQIDIRNQIDLTFTWIVFFICCLVLLIRFDLIKILLFWNGNLKSNVSDGPSWLIAAIVFCRTNINDTQHLQLNHTDN